MKISISWLKEWIDEIPQNISNHLTMLGLEVDSEALAAPAFTNIVVGEVLTVEPHPDADKLRIATVNVGEAEPLQIVCGAPNVAVGIKVPTAVIGAVLPGDFKIKKSKLRGVESYGMLCSARELGLSDDHGGLMILAKDAPIGKDFREYYNLNDEILEIDLTPNRGDCLSIYGVARDLALSTGTALKALPQHHVDAVIADKIAVNVQDKVACPRYLGRKITGLNMSAPSPLWMTERLRRAGVRPHGILVDITNYVMLELGQPLHAFDADKLAGNIHVRQSAQGESITLLNGDTVTLKANTLLIADDEKTVALAGIMGADNSVCDDNTTAIFLESAWFNPLAIAGRAREYGLHTDASHRFERGVDFNLPMIALEYATHLLVTLAGGQAGAVTVAEDVALLPKRDAITVRFSRISQLVGRDYAIERITEILSRIGDTQVAEDHAVVVPPSHRFDIEIENDLIEEIARIDGYDNIHSHFNNRISTMTPMTEYTTPVNAFNNVLVDRGYNEVITMSFVAPKWQAIIDKTQAPIALKNPISADLSVMRTTLAAGLIATIDYNLKRQQKRVRIFETGLTFKGELANVTQQAYLGGAVVGDVVSEQWGEKARKVDFFDVKNDVEALLALSAHESEVQFVAKAFDLLHPGQSAEIFVRGESVGYMGKIHPKVAKELDVSADIYLFELNLAAIKTTQPTVFKPLSKFPQSRRDLTLVVPEHMTVAAVIDVMRQVQSPLLQSIQLFDIYQLAKEDKTEKSFSFGLIFQNDMENIKDEEIDTILTNILKNLGEVQVFLRQ
ncbi:phenylalanine--tRNA ligase subunit beta [Wohlfahrtiimonas chitiniclastica]|uniref:Phenylalanine--tRNA ligase beta subunit n=1 Tax=Wohlfahrtiimonas chitiniclastica TaxID=400946 RepID=A0AB35BYM3_9GAMM|nr:phenylalanine--tRNA ligase subunit beta [Wohlfahrtiimonas chitiniclastica]MBS7824362.1 phenylalanine--tRNA ligase subunit beta [Wohlfahrtiimonas chitiniclastica]MBS7839888.1 phenylalanine--tRNA ligase subunit beta [Wohlfahrtiimonas chitiniclastica]MDC7252254.1 phenylalanine--tRNA ligase beta subunit [Wohlfahrtiimonas chitiniclastica]